MNRREFVKALAGIPLLGLLVKLSKRKVPYHEIDIFNGASHTVDLTWDNAERLAGLPEGEDYCYLGDKEPYLPTEPPGKAVFVDPATGSDDNSGLAPPFSFATIQRALTELGEPGDWIMVL